MMNSAHNCNTTSILKQRKYNPLLCIIKEINHQISVLKHSKICFGWWGT